jgi:hypothetical protein
MTLATSEIFDSNGTKITLTGYVYPDYGRGLVCPHCDLWIGDPEDPEIAAVSIEHDVGMCEGSGRCPRLNGGGAAY